MSFESRVLLLISFHQDLWELIKPHDEESLLYQIIHQPALLEKTTSDLLKLYREDNKKGILKLFQLLFDLSGLQTMQIAKMYDFPKAIVQFDKIKAHDAYENKFDFEKEHYEKWGPLVETVTQRFIECFINKAAESDDLYDTVLINHIEVLLKFMVQTCLHIFIRPTGLIFGWKLFAAISDLHSQQRVEFKQDILNNFMMNVFMMLRKNFWYKTDDTLSLRLICMKELLINFSIHPIFFIKTECVELLTRNLFVDPAEKVRVQALQIVRQIISLDLPEINAYFLKNLPTITTCVYKRCIKDNSDFVILGALQLMLIIQQKYRKENYLTANQIDELVKIAYHPNDGIAKESARLVIYDQKLQISDNALILIKFANLSYIEKIGYKTNNNVCYFVEACFENLPQLSNWKLQTEIIAKESKYFESDKCFFNFLEFITEAIYFSLNGQTRFPRNSTSVRAKSKSAKQRANLAVQSVFLPQINNYIGRFRKRPRLLNKLLDILLLVDFDNDLTTIEHLESICANLNNILLTIQQNYLVEKIAQVFLKLQTYSSTIEETAQKICEKLRQLALNKLLIKPAPVETFVAVLSHFLAFYRHFDSIEELDFNLDEWVLMYKNDETVFHNLIELAKLFLLWKLKKCDFAAKYRTHLKQFKEFCCMNLTFNGKQQVVCFQSLFEVYNEIYVRKAADDEMIDAFKFTLVEKQLVCSFVQAYFEQYSIQADNLSEIRTILVQFLQFMSPLQLFDNTNIEIALSYYHSHYKAVGFLLETLIQKLRKQNSFEFFIQNTIIRLLKQTLEANEGRLNKNSSQAKNLVNFITKIKSSLPKKSKSTILSAIVNLLIEHVAKQDCYYELFYFLEAFIADLTKLRLAQIRKLIDEKIPNSRKNNYFAQQFKSKLKL